MQQLSPRTINECECVSLFPLGFTEAAAATLQRGEVVSPFTFLSPQLRFRAVVGWVTGWGGGMLSNLEKYCETIEF